MLQLSERIFFDGRTEPASLSQSQSKDSQRSDNVDITNLDWRGGPLTVLVMMYYEVGLYLRTLCTRQ